ncbi:MAG TPA: ZIP family metal transporter [Vicinamibacterales bacterium]|nr:ZIP family metal transporter [Vicinamibacterales bacterium]HPK71379.1 ZIP family metal transporter [Vicinamibacterales bacterium]
MTLLLILLSSLVGGVVSVLLAATVLVVRTSFVDRALPRLISFSTGALLGAAMLGMIPHASRTLPVSTVALVVLAGLITFFVLEKLLVWRHCHKHDCDVHAASGPLLLLGDAFHNFVDGIVLAGAFVASTTLGLAAAVSTVAHEVPQELGEFMVYLRSGYSRKRALVLNSLTSLTTVVGAILGYLFLREMRAVGPYLLAFAAAGFLYVALADLVPSQRGRTSLRLALLDMILLAAGIGVIALVAHSH